MRKKWIALFLAGMVICNFTACGSGNFNRDNSSSAGKYVQVPGATNSASGLTSLIQRTGLFDRYCSTEDGFYYLTEEGSSQPGGRTSSKVW